MESCSENLGSSNSYWDIAKYCVARIPTKKHDVYKALKNHVTFLNLSET